MIARSMRRIPFVAALCLVAVVAVRANAQCCPAPTTAFYQPAAVTAFQPVAPVVQTGWYPGYWLDRIRARLWGAPTTYVAAYPTTVAARHPTAYHAAYAPTYTAAFRPVQTVAYAAAPAVAAPAVACPACPTCPTAVSYAAPAVGQVVQQAAPCPTCVPAVAPAAVVMPSAVAAPAPTPALPATPAPQRTFDAQNSAPALDPRAVVPDRPQDAQRPPTNGTQPIEPEPADDSLNDFNGENSTYFQAPKLFDPNDRTAQRSVAPVMNALYGKPASYRTVSTQPISQQQFEQDAIGWVSASN